MSDYRPGTLVHTRYRIVDVIARGGAATVYRADDELLGRHVALKVVPRNPGDKEGARRQAEEVRLLAGFAHPGLVTLFDMIAVDNDTRSALVMQYVDGTDLRSRIATGALGPARTAVIGADIAAALAHIHERGVIHRDVKPANILLPDPDSGAGQSAMLADFGIARLVDSGAITSTGTVVGTASYLSPEQAAGAPLGPPTDIYSLGLVLLEALTAVRAFPGNPAESMAARLSTDPPIPSTVGNDWAALLRAMLDRNPAARPPAAKVETALRHLADASGDDPTLRMPGAGIAGAAVTEVLAQATVATPPPTSSRPRRWAILLAAVLGAGVILVAAMLLLPLAQSSLTVGGATPPPSSPSPSPTPTIPAIEYPAVDGKLGERLVDLQQSVAGLSPAATAAELQAWVLSITENSANGDYEAALEGVAELEKAVDEAALSAAERELILTASDEVRSELEDLVKEQNDGPGNSDGKPGKKND